MEREKCFIKVIADGFINYHPAKFHQWGKSRIDHYVVSVGIVENSEGRIITIEPDSIFFAKPSLKTIVEENVIFTRGTIWTERGLILEMIARGILDKNQYDEAMSFFISYYSKLNEYPYDKCPI
jgi:hypothetical protein